MTAALPGVVMLRRLVMLRPHEPLSAAASSRSFSAAASHLIKKVKVAKMDFDPTFAPLRVVGRAATVAMEAAAKGFNYGGDLQKDRVFLVRSEFADQDAVERLKKDRADEVVGVYADPTIQVFPHYCGSGAVGSAARVATRLGVKSLRKAKLTGANVRVAIVDTGIDGAKVPVAGGWGPAPAYVPGSSIPDHGTMCAYDARIAAPDAKILDYALLSSTGSTWTAFLSDAVAAFADLIRVLQAAPGPLVVSNSWGMFDRTEDAAIGSEENYSANPEHPFNQIVSSLVAAGADVFFAAGNCGAECPDGRCGVGDSGPGKSIHGANSHPEVVTVAAVTVTDRRLGYSSQGPGGLYNRKPDLAAYSHFKGFFAVDGGTSAACPVAAGVCAALRQKGRGRKLTPPQMKGLLQRSAIDLQGDGWDYDLGYGVINAASALRALV
jgi:hypothetical protein